MYNYFGKQSNKEKRDRGPVVRAATTSTMTNAKLIKRDR